MIDELVIDANIFGLSDNPAMPEMPTCRKLLEFLLSSHVILVVDEDFSLDSALNKSRIGHEYMNHARHGTLGFALLVKCATSQRIRYVDTSVNDADRRFLKRALPRNTHDRIYVPVSMRASSRVLATNDWDDFTVKARTDIGRRLGVRAIPAHECLAEVTAA